MKDKCLDCLFYDDVNHICCNGSDEEPYPCKQHEHEKTSNNQNEISCDNCFYNDCCYFSYEECQRFRVKK